MIAIDTRPDSPFATWWHGTWAEKLKHKWQPEWDAKLLAICLWNEMKKHNLNFDRFLKAIQSSPSKNVNDWIREAKENS